MSVLAHSLLCGPVIAQGQIPNIVGDWATKDSVVRIAPCADNRALMCGIVIQHRPRRSEQNATGFAVLRDLTRTNTGWSGRSYDGEGNYSANLRVTGDRLILQSCLAPSLCETEIFQRAR
jgi:hypothetical protein